MPKKIDEQKTTDVLDAVTGVIEVVAEVIAEVVVASIDVVASCAD